MTMVEEKPKIPGEVQVDLALSRTQLASERTLLAWIRTSISLIGFGFTLAKFIHGYLAGGPVHGVNAESARTIGVTMILLGIAGLIGGIVDHYKCLTDLKQKMKISFVSPALIMAISLTVVGIYITIDVFMNMDI